MRKLKGQTNALTIIYWNYGGRRETWDVRLNDRYSLSLSDQSGEFRADK